MESPIKTTTKVALIETLSSMAVGQILNIPSTTSKSVSVRNAAYRLKKQKGYSYEVTERGLIDEVYVTRLK